MIHLDGSDSSSILLPNLDTNTQHPTPNQLPLQRRRLDRHVVGAQGRRGHALQLGERLIVVGLGAQLKVACARVLILPLEQQKRRRAPDRVESPLAL